MLGIGTFISAIAIGFCVQINFKLLKFDATMVNHETLDATFKTLISIKKEHFNRKEVTENQVES